NLRLTQDPIHIYAVGLYRNQFRDLPVQFFVTTFYPDGTPAECDVEIGFSERAQEEGQPGPQPPVAKRVRTNRYGIGFVDGLVLPKSCAEGKDVIYLKAIDEQGLQVRSLVGFQFSDGPGIRLEPGRAIHRSGEPLIVRVKAADSVPSAI